MKKFINRLLFFLFPIILMVSVSEVLLRNIPNDYAKKAAYLRSKSDSIQVLILGSSHAYRGVNPQYIEANAYNAAYVSQSFDYDEAILEKYLKDSKSLSAIILPISYFSLFSNLKNSRSSWRAKNYYIYHSILLDNNMEYRFEMLSMGLKYNLGNIYNYYIKSHSYITIDSLGFGPRDGNEKLIEFKSEGKKRANIHSYKDLSLYTENKKILNKLIYFTEKNHIYLLLYMPPADISYYSNLNNIQLTKTYSLAIKLDSTFKNVEFVDFLQDSDFKRKHFYDPDHLNNAGAKLLSEKINTILKKFIEDKKKVHKNGR